MSRTRGILFTLCAACALLAFVLASCGGSESEGTAGSDEQQSTIKIGVLNPTTGAQTQNGTDVNNGLKLYFDSIGNTVAGHPIELIFEDDASNPQQGLERARKLIDQDKVDLLMGVVHSGVAVGVAEYAAQREVPYIITCAGANALTGAAGSPYVFRTAETNAQRELVIGWYAAKKLGYETAALFSWDFVAGQEHIDAFKKAFEDAGGKVVSSTATPLPTNDFGPYLSKLPKTGQDAIWAFYASADAIRFVQQLEQFGFTPGIPVLDQGSLTEDEVLPEMGDAALGITGTTCYTWSLDSPVNKTFTEQYSADGSKHPGWYVYQGYMGAMVAAAALDQVGGDVSDKQAFLTAIQGVKVDGPGGPFSFDDQRQAVLNQYIVKVEKDSSGLLYHKVYETYDAVSQSWTPPAD
jgi:branched-chain amino acid transport system substrate-binding protein